MCGEMRIGVKQATRQGYIECCIPGGADLSYPTSLLRRGRVQGGVKSHQPLQHQVQ